MKKIFYISSVVSCLLLGTPAFSADSANPEMANADHYLIKNAPVASDFVLGKKNAPIVMIEYASLSCPHCAHFSNTVLPELQKKYIDTGKIRYILRQFPLNEPALKGAMLVDCIGKNNNDRYFIFAKALFDAQNQWAFDGNWLSGLETISSVGGVSKEQFKTCTNDKTIEIKLLKEKKQAIDELKIPYTPYIFIDGQNYSGEKTSEAISAFIDSRLAIKKQ